MSQKVYVLLKDIKHPYFDLDAGVEFYEQKDGTYEPDSYRYGKECFTKIASKVVENLSDWFKLKEE